MPVRRTLSLTGPLRKLWNGSSSFRGDNQDGGSATAGGHNAKGKPRTCRLKEGEGSVVFLRRDELQLGPILGEGGFAQVFGLFQCPSLLRDSSTTSASSSSTGSNDQEYSVKVIRKGLLEDKKLFQKAADDLVNEAEILIRLEHPNIIQLRALSKDTDQPMNHAKHYTKFFLLLDRLSQTLNDRIQTWRDDNPNHTNTNENNSSVCSSHLLDTKLRYAHQLAKALEYLHSKRILFRDLKPENIGFKGGPDDHHLILFDFGMARELTLATAVNAPQQQSSSSSLQPPPLVPGKPPKPNYNTQSSNTNSDTAIANTANCIDEDDLYWHLTVCGTQRYMSHEVLLDGKYQLKSDCYAWGMVVWEIVAHVKPFHYMSPTVHKILVCGQGDRPPLSCYGLSLELQELLKASWAHKVSDRLDMATICQRLEAHLGDALLIPTDTTANATTAKTPVKPQPSPAHHRRTGSHSPTHLPNPNALMAAATHHDNNHHNFHNNVSGGPTLQRFPTADTASIPIRSMMQRHKRNASHGGNIPIVQVDNTPQLDGVKVIPYDSNSNINNTGTPPRRMKSHDSLQQQVEQQNNNNGTMEESGSTRSPLKRLPSGGSNNFPPRSPTRPPSSSHSYNNQKRPMGPVSLFDSNNNNNSLSSRSPPRSTSARQNITNSSGPMLPTIPNNNKSPMRGAGLPRRMPKKEVSKSPVRASLLPRRTTTNTYVPPFSLPTRDAAAKSPMRKTASVFNVLHDNSILNSSHDAAAPVKSTPSHRRMRSAGGTSSPSGTNSGHRRLNSHGSIIPDCFVGGSGKGIHNSKENASPPAAAAATNNNTGKHRRMRTLDGSSAHSMASPTAKPINIPTSAHKRTGSGGAIRSINSIARDLLADKKPPTQQQPALLSVAATRSTSWDVIQATQSNANLSSSGKGPSLSELQEMKKDLKEQLKQFDIQFAQSHGRMPNKTEKEVIRPLYNHYNTLKDYISPLESLKKQLKQYDIQFAQTHGRMPNKAEKEVIRHLYDQYKNLKATIANYLLEYERQQARPPTTALFSDQRVIGGSSSSSMHGFSFDKLHSFDSDLTPEDLVVAEL
ncbi:Probable LIM domain-containing serine/threonine-protein kinase DDB [Seminavis robusta]|uniref:Probable LIM domain-containing serine/threonine-protein kinase DDB n=1 Tax=Seminavis robusta TaxID=568900 RepID=A0A9N8EEQ7_9STRA|nr:Probable LIM domain-containing serine/threonine-protein kinase DDB [Seminavis robusta]|eukprot:Sro833_g208590.1 Probable LIM domain-containing serine/threonine-protein kinase DDB (1073) ;mRNA; r:36826-40144